MVVSGRGATEDQLQKVNDKVNTNKTQIDKNKQDIADNKPKYQIMLAILLKTSKTSPTLIQKLIKD